MANSDSYPAVRVPAWFKTHVHKQIADARLHALHVPSQLEMVEQCINNWYRAYILSTNTGDMPPWMPHMGHLPAFLAKGSLGKLDSSQQLIYNQLIQAIKDQLFDLADPLGADAAPAEPE